MESTGAVGVMVLSFEVAAMDVVNDADMRPDSVSYRYKIKL